MEISKIDSVIAQDEEGVEVPIFGKDGEADLASDGTQTTITVVGVESARYRKAQDQQTRKMLRARRAKVEPEDIRANRIELAAAAIIAWHGVEDAGKDVPCTSDNVRAVLRAQYILEQVESGIQGHADFFGGEVLKLADAIAHEARLNVRDKDGFSTRDHLEGIVARDPRIRDWEKYVRELEGPEIPESLEYLRRWLYELHGRSGFSPAGINPLNYGTIADWSRLKQISPTPAEVEALIMLDAVLLNPPKDDAENTAGDAGLMDIAKLGLEISNAEANRAIEETGSKLDELGKRGERAAALHAASVQRVRQEYTQLTAGDLANATRWYDETYNAAKKVAAGHDAVAASTTAAVGGIGRLRQSFTSLAAQATGTSPIIDRILTTLGAFGVGNAVVIGVVAGIAAAAYAIHELSGVSEQSERAIATLRQEVERAGDAMGSMGVKAANAELATAKALLNGAGGLKAFFSKENMSALWNAGLGYLSGGAGGAVGAYAGALAGGQGQAQADQLQATRDAEQKRADALASLIRDGDKSHEVRQRAIALVRQDQAELATLSGKFDDADVARRVQLANAVKSLNDALYPKEPREKKPSFLDRIPFTMTDVPKFDFEAQLETNRKTIENASLKSVQGELKAGGILAPLRQLADLGAVMQTRSDITNAQRSARGQSQLGPETALVDLRKQATDTAQEMSKAVLASNLPWAQQLELLKQINAMLKEMGANAPKADQPSAWGKAAGYARSAADAANLFGGSRGAEWGNILNTAANATTNVEAAVAKGGTDPIADVQAALSIASLGKQIFSLGRQSHETKDRINEANLALKDTMSIESDILNHNPLQAMLDQVKQAYDQQYASINATLPGLKNQTQRNIDLAAATDMYNQKLALTQQQFALQQSDFNLSMQARKDAAMGLTFDAAKLNLQIQQQNEMANVVNTYGKDSIEAQTLATVQNSEMLRLVNQSLTQLTNSPTGFFAETYASDFATRQPWPTSSGSTTGSGGSTVTGNTINITVPDAGSPADTARAVVAAIRQIGQSTVGINGSVADAMEYM